MFIKYPYFFVLQGWVIIYLLLGVSYRITSKGWYHEKVILVSLLKQHMYRTESSVSAWSHIDIWICFFYLYGRHMVMGKLCGLSELWYPYLWKWSNNSSLRRLWWRSDENMCKNARYREGIQYVVGRAVLFISDLTAKIPLWS